VKTRGAHFWEINMPGQSIEKPPQNWRVSPNLLDYDSTCAAFSWRSVEGEFSGLHGGSGLNIAYEAVDRHAKGPRAAHLALRWLGKQGEVRDYSYADLHRLSNRFANVLRGLGIGKGERVFALAGRIPELYIAALGTLKNGSVFCPLFSAFGPEPIQQRLTIGEGKVLVTTDALYLRRRIGELRAALPSLEHVLVIGAGDNASPSGTVDYRALMGGA
jgi:acetyl-CoA synthetase